MISLDFCVYLGIFCGIVGIPRLRFCESVEKSSRSGIIIAFRGIFGAKVRAKVLSESLYLGIFHRINSILD